MAIFLSAGSDNTNIWDKPPEEEKYTTRQHEIDHSNTKYGTNSFWKLYRFSVFPYR
jgi:hypothetical protein